MPKSIPISSLSPPWSGREDIQHSDSVGALLNFLERSAQAENSKKIQKNQVRRGRFSIGNSQFLKKFLPVIKIYACNDLCRFQPSAAYIFILTPQYTYFHWSRLNEFIFVGYNKRTSVWSLLLVTCFPIEQWDLDWFPPDCNSNEDTTSRKMPFHQSELWIWKVWRLQDDGKVVCWLFVFWWENWIQNLFDFLAKFALGREEEERIFSDEWKDVVAALPSTALVECRSQFFARIRKYQNIVKMWFTVRI